MADVRDRRGHRVARAAPPPRGARAHAFDGEPLAWRTTPVRPAHVVGGLIFGVGWAIAGTCPGPAAAQIGQGHLAGVFTSAGIFAGVWLQGFLAERRATATITAAPPGACAEA